MGLRAGGDRVAFDGGRETPTVENRQDERFISPHSSHRLAIGETRLLPGIDRRLAKLFFDAQKLVVFGDAIGAAGDPVLICPAFVATARSAMKASSVSPERCETTAV